MKQIKYEVWDVFTGVALAGNQLGVVPDAAGLSDDMMQKIARELNLSETIFFLPPHDPNHAAKVRIFMPLGELPFAGHPTIGGAVARAARDEMKECSIVLEEGVGPVYCTVKAGAMNGAASFTVPRTPQRLEFKGTVAEVAQASGVRISEVGIDGHTVSIWSAGVPYLIVPLKSKEALASVSVDSALYLRMDVHREGKVAGGYYYARTGPTSFQVRMFAPWDGIAEDPATGSAAAAFAGALAAFDDMPDGEHGISILQGVEMGRRSDIGLTIILKGGVLPDIRISGEAVKIAEGTLFLPD